MANKQTAGLQLIDLKGIELANGPVKIKGVYQQVIANKFIKTITNLVYDGYAYDDFPITLTTTDGLTYTGKYIDTVSSEMLQWLSITINNQSEVTVTKELFQGGGGGGGGDVGYEEITEGTLFNKATNADLIVFKASKDYVLPQFMTVVKDKDGVTVMERFNYSLRAAKPGHLFIMRKGGKVVNDSINLELDSPQCLYIRFLNSNRAYFIYDFAKGQSTKTSIVMWGFNSSSSVQILESDFKFYRDKALSKLLESF